MHRLVPHLLDLPADLLAALEPQFDLLADLPFEHCFWGIRGLEIELAVGESNRASKEGGEGEEMQSFHGQRSRRLPPDANQSCIAAPVGEAVLKRWAILRLPAEAAMFSLQVHLKR
jgi:hypothetical protein